MSRDHILWRRRLEKRASIISSCYNLDVDNETSPEISLETVKKRSVRGVLVLTARSFLLSGISLIASAFLWAFLSLEQFGTFVAVSAVINFLNYFSDIGLAAALVQKKEAPTDRDLRTTFTIQQILVILLLVILFLFSPLIAERQKLTQEGIFLMYALGISLFLSSLKTIPSILLERKLQFEKLVFPQLIENVVYNVAAVLLAWQGMGVTSFTVAVILRGLVGLVLIYIIQPWRVGLAFSFQSLKNLLKFGVPYQLNSFLALVKDDGLIAVLTGILGLSGIAILAWAQKVAQLPLRFFMDQVTRVTFPAFSRMQDDKDQLAKSVTRSIFFISFLVFPSLVGILVIAPVLINVIPKYEKWTPALFPLVLVSVNTVFASITTQLTNTLNSIGKIRITFFLMVMWTVLTWLVIPYLALTYGINGAAAGYALVGSSSIVAIIIARNFVKFSLYSSAVKPLFASLFMGAILLIIRQVLPWSLYTIGVLIVAGGAIYMVTMATIIGASLISDVKRTFQTIFSKA